MYEITVVGFFLLRIAFQPGMSHLLVGPPLLLALTQDITNTKLSQCQILVFSALNPLVRVQAQSSPHLSPFDFQQNPWLKNHPNAILCLKMSHPSSGQPETGHGSHGLL